MEPVVEAVVDADPVLVAPPAPEAEAVVLAAVPVPEPVALDETLDAELLADELFDDEAALVVDGVPVVEAATALEVTPPMPVELLVCVPPTPPLPGSAGASLSGEEHPVRDMRRKQ